jgi:hypothetical protein
MTCQQETIVSLRMKTTVRGFATLQITPKPHCYSVKATTCKSVQNWFENPPLDA